MASIQTGIELNDGFTRILNNIVGSVNLAISAMESMQGTMNADIDTASLEAARSEINQATIAVNELEQAIGSTEWYIRDNVDEQGRFNREIEHGVGAAYNLRSMIASAVGAFAGMAGIRKAVNWIEECTEAFDTQRNAELQLMGVLANTIEADVAVDTSGAVADLNGIPDQADDVILTTSADTQALTAAFDTITAKASEIQSRGIYGDEAMIAGAAEFSTYFSDTDAIEMMMDTLADYAMGMSGGGALDSTAMVEYATGLGKIMSGSYDAMTKKGFEFTEAQKAVIEGTATQEQIIAAIGEEYLNMSEDVQAAAAINAVIAESWDGLYESMSNTPEGKIIQMVNAFGDMKEVVGGQLYPYVILFVDVITDNWPTIQKVLDNITLGLQVMMGVLSWLFEGAINFAGAIMDNWSWLSPIIYGVAGALAVYYGWQMAANAVSLISKGIHVAMAAVQMIHAAATGTLTAATAANIAAQNGLNASMYACPIVWIIVLIIALVAAFYAAIAAINKFADTSISATGLIAGYFGVCVAHFLNGLIRIQNVAASVINFLGNASNNFTAAVTVLFYDMCLTIIGYILNIASAIEAVINKIPGISVDITSGLDNFYSKLEEAQQAVKDESGWVEYVHKMDYIDYTDAFGMGYSFGEGIEDKISNFDPTSLFKVDDIPNPDDYIRDLTDGGIGSGIDDIAVNTDSIRDSLDCTEEDLKYLRDIAEQEAVNRFTVAEVKVEQTNYNNINSGMDLDGVVSGLTEAVAESVDSITEGV